MNLLRSMLYFVVMLLSIALFGTLLAVLGLLLPERMRDGIANTWGSFNLVMMRWICGLNYRVRGSANLADAPVIYMVKHQSTWETIALRGILPSKQSWVLKRELMLLPIFGWALKVTPNIAIDRKAGRKAVKHVVERGTDLLQQGRSIVIFPEGTRTAPGEHHKYGAGGAILAQHSGFPVVPVAHNAGVFWPRRSLRKAPGTIDVVVGAPIQTAGRSAKDIITEVSAWIEAEVAMLPQQP